MRRVIVMLSGGADSVCLLHRMLASHEVTALHVNYGLRPEAGGDEAFCRSLCADLGVPLEVRSAPASSGNVQAWARDVRYTEALRLAVELEADVAVGHTASDQVETVLYRLAASPGRRALLGMREREGRLIRPLLGWTRSQTREYCRSHGLPWREDASNESLEFARNRVRLELLEALRSVHPAAEANVLRTLEILRDEAEVLEAVVAEVATDSVEALRALPPALARLAVQRLAGPEAPSVRRHVEAILALPQEGTHALDVGSGWRAVVEYGRLRFDPAPAPGAEPAAATLAVPGTLRFGDGLVSAERGDFPPAEGVLDAATLAAPLVVRGWQPGDRMRPLGLGGTRSLQDLFTDRKIPRERRHSLPVVVSGEEIAWIPGVATAEAFKVTESTRERVRLAWHA
jgi:tRNA(Ile)-lysidine synthase